MFDVIFLLEGYTIIHVIATTKHIDEFITQKLVLKHTQTFRPCHMAFYDSSGLSHDRRVT